MLQSDFTPFWHFVNERHAIWLRKHFALGLAEDPLFDPRYCMVGANDRFMEEGRSGFLTDDPILKEFRFTNVFRELDRVTVWIRKNVREPFVDHPHLWLMLAIARTINWPETLAFLMRKEGFHSWPDDDNFRPERMGAALDAWKAAGNKTYTGAYMIRAESNPNAEWFSWTKQRYIAQIVLGRLWEDRYLWQPMLEEEKGLTLQDTWALLGGPNAKYYIGWGPFMAFQTVLEWRHTRYLRDAPDASTWAAVGPGSMRGLNRLHGRPVKQRLTQDQALAEMTELLELSRTGVLGPHVPPLEMEDVQNSLCETDKYLRVKFNEGTPRSRYVPGRGY